MPAPQVHAKMAENVSVLPLDTRVLARQVLEAPIVRMVSIVYFNPCIATIAKHSLTILGESLSTIRRHSGKIVLLELGISNIVTHFLSH